MVLQFFTVLLENEELKMWVEMIITINSHQAQISLCGQFCQCKKIGGCVFVLFCGFKFWFFFVIVILFLSCSRRIISSSLKKKMQLHYLKYDSIAQVTVNSTEISLP